MWMIVFIYVLTLGSLLVGWGNPTLSLRNPKSRLFNILFCLILILFVGFRDGENMPDYSNYLEWFQHPGQRGVEESFFLILNSIKSIGAPKIFLFVIYAAISVSIRYYAIIKYSPLQMFSMAAWFSFILILHEMIQIRAAVASALMLFLIPLIFNKRYIAAFIVIIISFLFHRSALIFILLFFINTKKDYWWFWTGCYLLILFLYIQGLQPLEALGINALIGEEISLIDGEAREIIGEKDLPNMLNAISLIETVTCFLILFRIKKISEIYPMAKIWLKIGFISITIYGTGIYIISVRLAEMFSTVFIFLMPLVYYCFDGKYGKVLGKITVFVLIIAHLSLTVFFREYIS